MSSKIWLPLAAAAVALAPVGAPVLAKEKKPAQPLSISAKDKQTGAKAHPEILKEFGGTFDAPQAAYVTRIGRKVAVQSGLSNAESDFTITLLNSPVNNAFAVPGGYVYVTRQLLGLMNSEAELASVLGHEVAHVAARHGQKRQSRATIGGLGTVAATILGGVLLGNDGARLGQQLGGSIANQWVLGYSRAQEYQADDLGISYIAKSGYDPLASSTMLASLAAQTSLDARRAGKSDKALPEWASTHPDPASRVTRAAQKAAATGSKSKTLNSDAFIQQLDGMLYDDDPKQGVVDGTSFKHPELRLAFDAPAGFTLANQPTAVIIAGSNGRAQFGSGPYSGDLDAYVGKVFQAVGGNNTTLNYGRVERATINGLRAAYASADAASQSGQQVTVTVYAYEFAPDSAYHVLAITPLRQGSTFSTLFNSVRRLSAQEAAAIRPRVIDVVTVRSGDTPAKLAERMAYADYKLERFLVLNGMKAGDTLRPGQKVKLIVYG
jgi:predicted Zn-dependent protease